MGAGHEHGHAAGRATDRARLRLVLALTGVVLAVELVGAWLTGSLALLADAGHMATDAAAVVLALGASYVAAIPAGRRSTFGYHRAEILAALVNARGAARGLRLPGVRRHPPAGRPRRRRRRARWWSSRWSGSPPTRSRWRSCAARTTGSLNLRAAATEVFADLLGSVLAVAAGVVDPG